MRTSFLYCLIALFLLASAATAQTPHSQAANPAYMDKSVDPCVDFYTYSCGGWMKQNPIPPDQASWGVYSKMQDDNRLILRGILEQAAEPRPGRSAVQQKIGDYYAACMDDAAVEKAGAAALQPEMARIAKLNSKADLAAYLAAYHPEDIYIYFGQSALFRFGSTQDAKDSSQVIVEVDQGGLSLPDRDYYLKQDAKFAGIRTAYLAHLQKMFELLGDAPDAAAANAQTVLRIETALAQGAMSRVDRRDPNKVYHRMSRAELAALSPSFDWNTYFKDQGLAGVQSLNVAVPDFFKSMETELKAEDLAAWKTYLRWHLAHAQARYLSSAFVNEDFNFYGKTLTGQKELQPRWKRCVRYIDRALGEALGQAYVEKYFPPQARQQAHTMVVQIEAAMEQDIRQLSWMSEPTKQQALIKLHAMVNKIGYPDHWRDYSKFQVVRDSFLADGERGNEFEFRRSLAKIGKPVDKGEWYMSPPTVNAYYDAQKNDINFPAGVLQPPTFDPDGDAAPNYGDTGGTIGHELTHGFDDEGRQFDALGNLRDWWTPQDAAEFQKRAQCVQDQYAQYVVVDDVHINSKLTLGEDVADLGGLILAWMAWKADTQGQRLQPLEGLTPEQRFFVGYAQSWCTNSRDEIKRMRATTDPHSPEQYRTNGVVVNLPEFQQAFQCKTGQPMAPEKRCRVW
jgi:endothelin-converting enzyme/putative endopeptidase